MAKQRQQNSIVEAIKSITAALKLESIPNPTPEQLEQIHQSKIRAANIIENSGIITSAEFADEDNEARICHEEAVEEQMIQEEADIYMAE